LFVDDPSVLDDQRVIRRIPPIWRVVDHNNNSWRVSSAAFANSSDGSPTSVSLETEMPPLGQIASRMEQQFPGYSLAALTVAVARANAQGVQRDPTAEDPSHALLFGKKTDGIKSRLAKACVWVFHPPHIPAVPTIY
jgi:hypothetical protein